METEIDHLPHRRPLIGLALGSGAARGWAHIGVIQALEELGIRPDVVCGTSIGAVVGGAYVANKLDAIEDWARSLTRIGIFRYMDFGINSRGLLGGRKLRRLLDENFQGMAIEDLPRPFAAITTELSTGHEIWIRSGPLSEALTASYALPGLFPPVNVSNRWLIDGALVNPVPVSVCRAYGARLVIAVNLNADVFGKGNVSGETADLTDLSQLMSKARAAHRKSINEEAVLLRKIFGHSSNDPSILNVMIGSLNILQDRLSRSRLAGDPPDVTVAPRLGHVGLLEFGKADEAIEEGKAAVDRVRPFIADALKGLTLP